MGVKVDRFQNAIRNGVNNPAELFARRSTVALAWVGKKGQSSKCGQ